MLRAVLPLGCILGVAVTAPHVVLLVIVVLATAGILDIIR